MRKEDIYIAIVSQPFYMAERKVLGVPLRECILRGLAGMNCGVYGCEKEIVRPNCRYFALLYDDMPLVTAGAVVAAADRLALVEDGRLGLGRGYIERSGNVRPQKISVSGRDFLSVKGATDVNIVYNKLKARRAAELMRRGVIILGDAEVDYTAEVESGVTLSGAVRIKGNSVVRAGAAVDNSEVWNSEISSGVRLRHFVVEDGFVDEGATVGPFAYIRGGSCIGKGVRIGDFVEVKNSTLADGVKAAHLAYIGDADVGENTNVGCGTVFCNYDGRVKWRTTVGSRAFIGANANLIAPLAVGDDSYVAAGSTVTDDVPANAFCIARERQINKTKK